MLVTNYTVWELPKEGCEHKQKACCFFLLGCDLRFRTLYPVLGTCLGWSQQVSLTFMLFIFQQRRPGVVKPGTEV